MDNPYSQSMVRLMKSLSTTITNRNIFNYPESYVLRNFNSYVETRNLGYTMGTCTLNTFFRSIFKCAYKHFILSYINNHVQLGDKIVDVVKQYLFHNKMFRGHQLSSCYFLINFQNECAIKHLEESDIDIDLIVSYFCYIFAPQYLVGTCRYDSPFFSYLFAWSETEDGFTFWQCHENKFTKMLDNITIKELIKTKLQCANTILKK